VCEEPPPLVMLDDRRKSRCWVAHRGETFAERDDRLLQRDETA
jgi:hypothetical protein